MPNWQPFLASQLSSVHGLPSLQTSAAPGTQAPLAQLSPAVQAVPSSQLAVLLLDLQPPWASQVSVVQGLLSSHGAGAVALQTPEAQVSPVVQLLPSSQGSALLAKTQPVILSHESSVQGLPSLQGNGPPARQAPAWQTSPVVQTSPSVQPRLLSLCTQPSLASQLSVVQGFLSSHSTAGPATQLQPTHASPQVQALSSLQARLLSLVWVQPADRSQVSLVQGLLSSQLVPMPGWQPPSRHASPVVHGLSSLQAPVTAAWAQPFAGSQVSLVQTFLSSQLGAGPGTHTPPLQASPTVHSEPSLQLPAIGTCWQPNVLSQLSEVHTLVSSQLMALPPWHLPWPQVSPVVQASPSSQAVASAASSRLHTPAAQAAK